MKKNEVSKKGFVQTIANYTGFRQTTVSERKCRNRSGNSVFIQAICADLKKAQEKVMEKMDEKSKIPCSDRKNKETSLTQKRELTNYFLFYATT
jgi:hypothetical protein